jgi:hypothetical protein
MKVVIITDKAQYAENQQYDACHAKDIESLDNGIYEEILIECLDNLNFSDRISILDSASKKLRYNGRLVVSSMDCIELGRNLFLGNILEKDFSEIINHVQSISSLRDTEHHFSSIGLTKLSASIDGIKYTIIGEKVRK